MKYALIGCGRISPNHIVAAQNNGLEIVAICDIVEQNMHDKMVKFKLPEQVHCYTDYLEMLDKEKPELVAIATESGKHAEIAINCLKKGHANIIVEKPIALSLADADRIIAAAKEEGLKVCACHQNRFNKSIQKIREAVDMERFGKLLHGTAHIRWANIVAKKTAKDGATSKIYAKFGVEIYAAAKQGEPDPELNTSLKFVIERAKQAQVPKHVIDKAIDKAKGGGDETFVQGRYEGFGPNGSMIIAETLTSNVNRTIANVRTIFNKKGGNIGAAGSVSYMFDNTGVIVFKGTDPDHIFEILLEAEVDVRDVTEEEGNIVIYTEPTDLHKGIAALKAAGITEFSTTELEMIAQSEVELSPEDLEIFEGLVDALEDDDDVQKVYHNVANL